MNTNSDAKRVMCFGDSNTWGYISGSNHERMSSEIRWPGALQLELGFDYEVIEEGLNSRAINNEDNRPGKEGRNAMNYIVPCIDTHDPLDWIIIMLGANELKNEYDLSPAEVGELMRNFIKIVKNRKPQFRQIKPKIILVSTHNINEKSDYCRKNNKYLGASAKSRILVKVYEKIAAEEDIYFVDAFKLSNTGPDGIHFTSESHKHLALVLAKVIKQNK